MRASLPLLLVAALSPSVARADLVPPAASLPTRLSLDDAMRLFRTRGLDLLIAEAAVRNAEGAVAIAGAMPNPQAQLSIGNAITFNNSPQSQANCLQNGAACSPWVNSVSFTDSAAIEDTLSGKRGLRLKVARNALAAAKMSRVDAERTIGFQVRATYVQVAQAFLAWEFARQVAESSGKTLVKFQARFDKGAINIGDLQRVETQVLEAQQSLDQALAGLRQARVALAFLLGVRGEVNDFEVDTHVLDFRVPSTIETANELELLRVAYSRRPDLLSLGYQRAASEAQVELTRRLRFPDITLGVTYAFGGFGGYSTNGPVGPQVLSFSLAAPLPVLYQLEGEQRQAEAQRDTSLLQQARQTAQVSNEVQSAVAGFIAARRLVERMEGPRRPGGGLLQSAKGAFDVIAFQYEKGAASLTDYLDALRTYVATKVEYFGDLANYWTAVFQLEQAVGTELP